MVHIVTNTKEKRIYNFESDHTNATSVIVPDCIIHHSKLLAQAYKHLVRRFQRNSKQRHAPI